jgi:capsular exopolysaccharide synthesis family protein
LQNQKKAKVDQLTKLVDDKGVDPRGLVPRKPRDPDKQDSDPDEQDAPDGQDSLVSLEQYRAFRAEIMRKQLEVDEIKFILAKRQEEAQNQFPEASDETSQASLEQQRQTRIKDMFQRDNYVASLISDIVAADEELQHTKGVARKNVDPARRAAEKRKAELTARYESLWAERYDQIRQQVLAEESTAAMASGAADAAANTMPIEALQVELERSERRLAGLKSAVEDMNIERKASQSDAYAAEVLRADVQTLMEQIEYVNRKCEDLKFAGASGTEGVEVRMIDKARAPSAPTNNKRTKFLILAPALVLCLVLGLFVLLEVKAERVADPDSLSTRVQSEVYSLPPLPVVRASNQLSGPGDDDQIDRFIQRLDHLRFALCGDHPDVGLGRCVLITSAIGGEGKTTLAAQLAARCGHAGHSTLLIDADLRRGSLCPLLDVPEGLGLSDVLKEEANAEDVVIPVQGGTFHLLCAGTPVSDTSRIFQGRNFGMLIARLRQSYDLIIIDSPPVLPVPDGLILGRWTDGAVLASRYDVSRAPQVERARRQLTNAGIPVLGTVINGMKSADSYYGRYSYSRGRSSGYSDSNGPAEG